MSTHADALAIVFKGYTIIYSILHEIGLGELLNTFLTNDHFEANRLSGAMNLFENNFY